MGEVFFISGIDTGVGKTVATGLMARSLRRRGINAVTIKLVQTGNVGYSEDRDAHRKSMEGIHFSEDDEMLTAPEIYAFPASPHLAAKLENRVVSPQKIADAVRTLAERYDVVLAEGAGGLAVPLTEDLLTVDFAAAQKWPLILVASGKLGSLNHAILSIECAVARGMKIRGVVYNYCPGADPVIDADTPRMIQKYLARHGQPEVLVSIPKIQPDTPPNLDFSAIFHRS